MSEGPDGNKMNTRFGNGSNRFEVHIPTRFQLDFRRAHFYSHPHGGERHVIEENDVHSAQMKKRLYLV